MNELNQYSTMILNTATTHICRRRRTDGHYPFKDKSYPAMYCESNIYLFAKEHFIPNLTIQCIFNSTLLSFAIIPIKWHAYFEFNSLGNTLNKSSK